MERAASFDPSDRLEDVSTRDALRRSLLLAASPSRPAGPMRAFGARSSHLYMPRNASSARAYAESVRPYQMRAAIAVCHITAASP